MTKTRRNFFALVVIGILIATAWWLLGKRSSQPTGDSSTSGQTTQQRNAELLAKLPFQDKADFEDAKRGFIAAIPDATVVNADGKTVWSLKPYDFLKSDTVPDTVNPSLWRHASVSARQSQLARVRARRRRRSRR